ncbi:uncharacterized protein LOC129262837 [Lytechinus pictus]|uniref:uncharacterized protein LOC129262837 n=1 Tax=Lytechinus pictus TaxID=7653 RepID=UPI0030B9E9B8
MAASLRPYLAGWISGAVAMTIIFTFTGPVYLGPRITPRSLPQIRGSIADRDVVATTDIADEDVEGATDIVPRNKRMILATTNSGFLHFTKNWLESLKRSGVQDRIVIVAEDAASFKAINAFTDYPSLEVKLAADAKHHKEGVLKFSSEGYLKFVNKRPSYISHFLKKGFDVLFSDVDIVLLQDPFPHFDDDLDVTLQMDVWKKDNHNHSDVFCAGFVYYQSTNATREFLKRFMERIAADPKTPDQVILNRLLRERDIKKMVRIHPMNGDLFVSGRYYFDQSWRALHTEQQPVMIHNNWIKNSASKVKRFKELGLWYI